VPSSTRPGLRKEHTTLSGLTTNILNTFIFSLTGKQSGVYKLNMFKTTDKGLDTRAHIFQIALRLFREKGFDETTMRDIANEAELALGAAYYYFPSKESIVVEYYEYVQTEHQARCSAIFASTKDLKKRLTAAVLSKLDILGSDRKLLSALFRYGGNPEHPLSWFGPGTQRHRETCMKTYAEAIANESLPKDLKVIMPAALWALDMGILLYLLFDKSSSQKRTRRLAEGAMELVVLAEKLMKFPLLRPLRKKVIGLLDEAGLIPEFASRL
jgi:AcrR family transcriptional regulator